MNSELKIVDRSIREIWARCSRVVMLVVCVSKKRRSLRGLQNVGFEERESCDDEYDSK